MNSSQRPSQRLGRVRVVGTLTGALAGAVVGINLIGGDVFRQGFSRNLMLLGASVVYGAVILYLLMPQVARTAGRIATYFEVTPPQQIAFAGLGMAGGLALAALAGTQLVFLPDGPAVTFFAGAVVLAIVGGRAGNGWGLQLAMGTGRVVADRRWLAILDTSATIDDRMGDLAKTGLLGEALVVTTAVTKELQRMADSGDQNKVMKGRKGLDTLAGLRGVAGVETIFWETKAAEGAVDDFLLQLARERRLPVVTVDFTLTRRARAEGLRAIDINEVAVALRPKLMPESEINLGIIRKGNSEGQGVGYLEDGTMVVVEDGGGSLHQQVRVTITSVMQTASGRMVFARIGAAKPRTRSRQ